MKKSLYLILSLVFVFFATDALSQDQIIRGRVYDNELDEVFNGISVSELEVMTRDEIPEGGPLAKKK